jgi:hypothetical protein
MVDEAKSSTGLGAFLKEDWPYIAILILALIGVAFASLELEHMALYWELLIPFFAAVCIYARLRNQQHKVAVTKLLRIEALHWGAVFGAMRLLYTQDVAEIMNANASALMMMVLLALGTFTAGAQIGAWRISLVGAVLGAAVPFLALLQRASLLVTLVSVALLAIVGFYLSHRRRPTSTTA